MQTKSLLYLIGFLGYAVLSYFLLFRDKWALEVITTKFYPQWVINLPDLKLNTVPSVVFIALIVSFFVLYARLLKSDLTKSKVVLLALVAQAVVFFSYPVLSTDILSYILSDRIAEVYRANVWTTKPNVYTNDPYYYAVYPIYKDADWTNMTRIYGGVNQSIYTPFVAFTTKFFGADFIANVMAHKLVVMIFAVLLVFVLAKFFDPKSLAMVVLNPLFIIESVGSGHNDVIMLFFVVLSLVNFRRAWLMGILLGLATQVKTTPFLLFSFLSLGLFSQLKIKNLVIFVMTYLATVLGIYYLMGVNPIYTLSRTAGSIGVFWQSLPAIIHQYFPILGPIIPVGLLAMLAVQVSRLLVFRFEPVTIYAQTLIIYLGLFLAAFWNWYPIWILVLLPFINSSRLRAVTIGFTFSALSAYGTMWLGQRFVYQTGLVPAIMYLTVLSGPVLGYVFYKKISV